MLQARRFASAVKRKLIALSRTAATSLLGVEMTGRLERERVVTEYLRDPNTSLAAYHLANQALERLVTSYPADTAGPLGVEGVADLALELAVFERFFAQNVGRSYGVGREKKLTLLQEFKANHQRIPSATSWLYHIVLATEILALPPDLRGDVIECGCWKGGSTANLSLVCELVGRKLIVCDSFEGLPEDDKQVVHQYPHLQVFGYYQPGMYVGRLEEVKENISQWGRISVCQFVPGFFADTLPSLTGPIAFAFLDVDLVSSMRDCIKNLWPLLTDGGVIYTDDSCDMEVVRIWFDDNWWQRHLGQRAPGYVGSGCGLPLSPKFSALGYARKVTDPVRAFKRVSWLYYPDDRPHGQPFPQETSK